MLRRVARAIGETIMHCRQGREPERRALYERLLMVARASRRQAGQVRQLLERTPGAAAARWRAALDRFAPFGGPRRGPDPAAGRAGGGRARGGKVLSLFEPHTCLVRRGKAHQPTEFGRKVWLDEVDGGIVSGYTVLAGNASKRAQVVPRLAQHRAWFGRPSDLLTAEAGVRHVALAPPRRARPALRGRSRQRWFRHAYRWRMGIQGRISLLRRRFGWRRCRYHGEAGLERWVGWGVIALDLRAISRTISRRRAT